MRRCLLPLLSAFLIAPCAWALEPFPSGFHTQEIATNGTTLHVRIGGAGPAVVMLHGFGDTGDMWAPAASVLVKHYMVVVADLRGMGLSAHPDTGYTKKNQAADIAGVMDALKIEKADLVTHDIGNMVGYALAAQYRSRITKWVVIDAPIPGIGNWDEIKQSPLLWHFNFRGPDEERLVAGRERIYLDRFYNELSADPKRIDEVTRRHYALRSMHGPMRCMTPSSSSALSIRTRSTTRRYSRPGENWQYRCSPWVRRSHSAPRKLIPCALWRRT